MWFCDGKLWLGEKSAKVNAMKDPQWTQTWFQKSVVDGGQENKIFSVVHFENTFKIWDKNNSLDWEFLAWKKISLEKIFISFMRIANADKITLFDSGSWPKYYGQVN